ncbi:MAG: hypothetical protein R3A44_18440 [Caldilineaceae bacterium]
MPEVILYTRGIQRATEEIVGAGGRITQQFGVKAVVADIPETVDLRSFKYAKTTPPKGLDNATKLLVETWRAGGEPREALAPDLQEGISWDAPGYAEPLNFQSEPKPTVKSRSKRTAKSAKPDDSDDDKPAESTGTPTSRYMIGSIAVGIIMVSGPNNLALSDVEQRQVISEVQEGLRFLANAEPCARITFVYDVKHITVDVQPGDTSDYEKAEAPWRNAALKAMGFAASRQGSVTYVRDLQRKRNTQWAYVGYFTKYPLRHFAYAIDEKLVMSYDNDGWGPARINQVFAHETCHIFGAADEYGRCTCHGSGELNAPNANCVNCTAPGNSQLPCLMNKNELVLCLHSRKQIGWDAQLFPRP